MKFKLPALVLAPLGALFAIAGVAAAKGSAEAGQTKTATCVACHGLDGNSVNPEWPTIAGQHEQYTLKQLKAFKTGVRQNVLMSPMATPLSEQDMEDLAAYYASQTAKGLEADRSKVQLGQQIYRGGGKEAGIPACIACHGPDGKGNPAASYPSIRGQHAAHVALQLRAYKKHERTTDQNEMMRDIAVKLSDEQIDAVSAYVQGLR